MKTGIRIRSFLELESDIMSQTDFELRSKVDEAFYMFDKDLSGSLEGKEVTSFLRYVFTREPTANQLAEFMAIYDISKDNCLQSQ